MRTAYVCRIRLRIREYTLRHSLANCDTPKDRTRRKMKQTNTQNSRRNVLYFCFDFLFFFFLLVGRRFLRQQTRIHIHTAFAIHFFSFVERWLPAYFRFIALFYISRRCVLGIEFVRRTRSERNERTNERQKRRMRASTQTEIKSTRNIIIEVWIVEWKLV